MISCGCMALRLYRRHRKECEGGHPEDARSGEFEEGRRGWEKCAGLIHVSGTLGGKFSRKQTGKSDWDEARAIAAEWEAGKSWESPIKDGPPKVAAPDTPHDDKRISLNDATSAFMASRKNRGLEASTLSKYQTSVKQLRAYCDSRGYVLLSQLTVADMDRFYASWKDGKRAGAKKLERLKGFVKFCLKRKWLTEDITEDLQAQEGSSIPANKMPFTDAELDRIYAACDALGGPTAAGPGHRNWSGEDVKGTQLDIAEARRREVSQQRFTSLDGAIARNKRTADHSWDFLVRHGPMEPLDQYVLARLRKLETMGLAEATGLNQWWVRQDFETALRAMQRLGDLQKILAVHGVRVSDPRLPLVMFDVRNCTMLEGRVLVHGEDEGTGRIFMMIEGTDAKVHCVYHTAEMAEARSRGGLRANRFVRLCKRFENGLPLFEVDELGRSIKSVRDRLHHEEMFERFSETGMALSGDGHGDGRAHDQNSVRKEATELDKVPKRNREQDRSRGR